MKTDFVTKGFEMTESMNRFLVDHTVDILENLIKNERDVHLRVIVLEDSHRSPSRKPHFACEIQIKTARTKWLKVRKTSSHFYEAASEAGKSMRRLLGRLSDKRLHRKLSHRERLSDFTFEDNDNSAA